ncbi:diaminopimelate epimerase [Demequina mangrovi]|uniref:Diaminopimelate epimerase n=1 Tax=Demequina mangrovi TaxID=1043493 RepID=A0A1H6Z1Y8_9MICO|nr:diaminopimelate epimerase [Demequina mangrovi]SEJ47543.1 diaminopimelate epimerase [Demequina mangrovi]
MTALAFTKGHGTENDFVLLFDPHGQVDLDPGLVRYLCDRRAGIGGDGVIRAVRAGGLEAGAGLAPATWFMDYWNADGTTSEMCGNGARVFGAFLEAEAGEELGGGTEFATRGGPRTVRSLGGGRYAIGMGAYRVGDATDGFDSEVAARGLEPVRPALSVDMGNPHHVVALADVGELAALDLTEAPEVRPVPPHGTNVEFAVALGYEERDGETRGRVRMRVHERGSGETRSCGTGACAVALAMRTWAGVGAPDVWDVEVPGGEVTVRIVGGTTVLEGPAVLVATGTVETPAG